jgi:hypothetical protein
MPILAIAHLLVVLYFGVHAIRTGRNMYWLMVLFLFPVLGCLVYFFAEYLPEMRHSRIALKATSAVKGLIDPHREWREAKLAYERTPSVDHRSRLAAALLDVGRTKEAVEHFEACSSGPYAKDSKFRIGLARAQLADGQAGAAALTLEKLFADEPDKQSGELSLLYARALGACDPARADEAFGQALRLNGGMETRAAYGLFLVSQGRPDAARAQLQQVMDDARLGNAHAREMNRAAIDSARTALAELDRR